MTTPPIRATVAWLITPMMRTTAPTRIEISATGRPPNGLGGRSPYAPIAPARRRGGLGSETPADPERPTVPSGRPAACSGLASRGASGRARAVPGLWRLRERRLDL